MQHLTLSLYIWHKTHNNTCWFSLWRLTLDLIACSLNVLPSCHHNAGSLKILSHSSVSDFKAPKSECHPHTMQASYKLERLLLLTSWYGAASELFPICTTKNESRLAFPSLIATCSSVRHINPILGSTSSGHCVSSIHWAPIDPLECGFIPSTASFLPADAIQHKLMQVQSTKFLPLLLT